MAEALLFLAMLGTLAGVLTLGLFAVIGVAWLIQWAVSGK